ncbi:MAG TPA: hypothetical protein VMV51_09420 [Gemmatimonadaceae bacterium]|nr:hypothetical protein [Gemmatimonadaceae bacterium]
MRATHVIAAVLMGIAGVVPTDTRAQVSVSISLGAQLGPPMPVFAYSPARYGPWRAEYGRWAPVVVYEMNGRYYHHRARGARAIEVYAYGGDYFLPPRDAAWVGFDRRYDYDERPGRDDFVRVDAYPERRDIAAPLVVGAYAAGDVGGWRTSLMLWTPVTVYAFNGAYYSRAVPGSRSVEIYRYRGRYFMPPDDRAWIGADRRYDYRRRPEHDDDDGRGRAHGRGRGHGHGGN